MRVFGLRASSRDARGLHRLPESARSAGCNPPSQSRARDRLTRGLRAGARREPERGCRPAGARAGAGPAWGGASRQPSALPARLCQSHCGPGFGPALRDAAGLEAALGWCESRALPLTSRAARPRQPRAPESQGPKDPSVASTPDSLATGY